MKKFYLFALLLLMAAGTQAQRPSDLKVYTSYDSDAKILHFYYDRNYNSRDNVEYYDPANLGIRWQNYHSDVQYIVIDNNLANANLTSMKSFFYGGLYPDEVNGGTRAANLDHVTVISGLQYLNTANVTDMSDMFRGLARMTTEFDLSTFNTSKVTDMHGMFNYCASLPYLDLRSFNTDQVTDMSYMFCNCHELISIGLRNISTSSVTNMKYMFYNCHKLDNLDLSAFEFGSLTTAEHMFSNCENLRYILCMDNMGFFLPADEVLFQNWTRLAGGLTSPMTFYSEDHITADYAHPSSPSNPGYFTIVLCLTVSNVEVIDITATSAKITWVFDENHWTAWAWEVGYHKGNDLLHIETVYETELNLTGLTPNTKYSGYVAELCANGKIPGEGITFQFTTARGEGIDEVLNRQSSNLKVIRDGQLFILVGDKTYNATGVEVK